MEEPRSLLEESGLLSIRPDEALDRLVRLAARCLGVPIAFVAIRKGDELLVRSAVGLPAEFASNRSVPLDRITCGRLLELPEPLIVDDVGSDPRIAAGSAAERCGIRAFSAVPLRREAGEGVGVLVVMDRQPRNWTEPEVQALHDLSSSVLTELEWRFHAAERARAADRLRQNEERYRLMIEGGEQVFFYTHDTGGRFQYVSPTVHQVLGYRASELVGQTYHVLFTGDQTDREIEQYTAATLTGSGRPTTYATLVRHRDGHVIVLELVESAIRDGDEVVGVQGFARDITDRRRSEEELRIRTAHLERLIESAPEAIVVLDLEERVTRVNREFTRVFGYEAAEAVGRYIADLIVDGDGRAEADAFGERVKRGETVSARAVRRRRDGGPVHVSILATPVVVDGAPTAIFGIYRDITAQVGAEEALAQREEYFRSLIEKSTDVIDVLDADGTIRYSTQSVERVLGYTRDEVVGRQVLEFVHPHDAARLVDSFQPGPEPREDGPVFEARVLHKDGGWRHFEAAARNLLHDPVVAGIVLTSRDISARVEAAAELQRFAVILASIPDAVVVTDLGGMVTYWNDGASDLFGWNAEEMLGASLGETVHPEMRDRFASELERVLAGDRIHGEYEHIRRDGVRILADTRVSLICNDKGRPTAVLRITRDITEQRLLARILDDMPEAVVCLDAENRIVSCNAAAEHMFGYSADELRDQPAHILAAYTDPLTPSPDQIVAATRREGGWTGEVVRRRKDGTEFPALVTTGIVRDSQGRVIGQAGLIRDLSDEKQRDAQLRRAERMSSLGTLIGGLTHELNNPLTSIRSFAQLLLLDDRAGEDREGLQVIYQEADRAAKLVADLRMLARQTQEVSAPPRQATDLNEIVRRVLGDRGPSLAAAAVEVRSDFTEELLPVWCDQARLEQAVRQLVQNAEHALASVRDQRRLIVRTRPSAKGVSLSVVDNGPGISASNLEHIFDPFWTTKAPGEGAGLGLSMVHTVVSEHGGEVRVESEIGKGSCFVVELPWTAGASRGGSTGPAAPRLRILVAEDEAPIRSSLSRFLERRGHRVESVEDGREALRRIEGGGQYEVIVSDFRMPDLSGRDLFDRLVQRGDGMEQRMVFVTGGIGDAERDRFLTETSVPLVAKPFNLSELADLIERRATRA